MALTVITRKLWIISFLILDSLPDSVTIVEMSEMKIKCKSEHNVRRRYVSKKEEGNENMSARHKTMGYKNS